MLNRVLLLQDLCHAVGPGRFEHDVWEIKVVVQKIKGFQMLHLFVLKQLGGRNPCHFFNYFEIAC